MRVAIFSVIVLAGCSAAPQAETVLDTCAPKAVAVDAARIYWSTSACDGGSIRAASKIGAGETVLASSAPNALGLTTDDAFVYWLQTTTPGAVARVSKGGGEPQIIASGLASPEGLLVDDNFVYWYEAASGDTYRAPKGGLGVTPDVVAPGVILDGRALDQGYLYLAHNGGVERVAIDAGIAEPVFAPDMGNCALRALAAKGSSLFVWVTKFDGITGTSMESTAALYDGPQLLASYDGDVLHTAIDDQFLFWFDRNELRRRNLATGNTDLVATAASAPTSSFAEDDQYLYWCNYEDNEIVRAAK